MFPLNLVHERSWLNQAEHSPNFRALSLFRILFASYLLIQFAGFLPYYNDFYSAAGVMPLATLAGDHGAAGVAGVASMLPLIRLLDMAGVGAIVPVAYPLSLIALAVGYRTRWACGIAFLLDVYLFWRNPYVVNGAEVLVRLLLLWCLFLPINRYWSFDAALDRLPRQREWPALPFFAMRLQIASLYFFSALFKIEGEPWLQGYALIWTLQDTMFAAKPLGLFLVAHWPGLLIFANYVIIAFQLAFPYLIYSPWRNELTRALAIAGSAAMHLSFIVFLSIGGFPYLCLIMLVLLVPDNWIDRLRRRRSDRLRGIAIYFEPGCGFCEKVARLLHEFLLMPEVKVCPASTNPVALDLLTQHRSWVVIDPQGNVHLKWRAVAYVLLRCPLTAPLGWLTDLPALRPVMARFYDCIGAHRRALGAVSGAVLPFRSARPVGSLALAVTGLLAALALLCNLVSLDQWKIDRGDQEIHYASGSGFRLGLEEVFAATQVRQVWMLFSPTPTHWTWSFSFGAVDATGNVTDVTAAMPFVDANDSRRYSHIYWVRYFSRSENFVESDWRAFGDYMCRAVSHAEKPAAAVEVTFVRVPVPSPSRGDAVNLHRRISCPSSAA